MSRVRMNWDWLVDPDSRGLGGKAIIVFSEFKGDDTFLVRYSIREDHNKLPGPREPADQEVTFNNCRSHHLAFEKAKAYARSNS